MYMRSATETVMREYGFAKLRTTKSGVYILSQKNSLLNKKLRRQLKNERQPFVFFAALRTMTELRTS